jgi:hypothetical protein
MRDRRRISSGEIYASSANAARGDGYANRAGSVIQLGPHDEAVEMIRTTVHRHVAVALES